MTATEVLHHLEVVGAVLVAKPPDGKLFVRGPKGAITRELINDISAHKDELRGIIAAQLRACEAVSSLSTAQQTPVTPTDETFRKEIDHWIQVFGGSVAEPAFYPAPTPLRPVMMVCGGKQVRLTLARHNSAGENRFGQTAANSPYCAIDLSAWRGRPFDLARVRWYGSPEKALKVGIEKPDHSEHHEAEDNRTCATFPGGIHVAIRRQGNSRWLMWVERHGIERRRKDFASPYLDHARRSAEHFYGIPAGVWVSPSSGEGAR